MVDLALALDPDAASIALGATRTVHPVVLGALARLRDIGEARLLADLDMTETGRQHGVDMADRVAAAIEHLA